MFPPYCGGPCTLLPNSYVKSAFDVAKNTNPGDFHDEDVLFTGIIRVKSSAPEPTKVKGICTHYNDVDKVEKIRREFRKLAKKIKIIMVLFPVLGVVADVLFRPVFHD